MQVFIKNYLSEGNKTTVFFSSLYGEGIAEWDGRVPIEGTTYDVEIEIPNILKWGKDIYKTNNNSYSIEKTNNLVCFSGILESINTDDGCCAIRVGDTIILLETEGSPINEGSSLSFKTEKVILYHNNL